MQYDPLWEQNPRIQEDRARSRTEEELQASRRAVITIGNSTAALDLNQ